MFTVADNEGLPLSATLIANVNVPAVVILLAFCTVITLVVGLIEKFGFEADPFPETIA